MKTTTFLILLLALAYPKANAQTSSDLSESNQTNYYWFGIDYSNVKIIDCVKTLDTYQDSCLIRDKYFKSWNNLIVSERKKYSVEKMVGKDTVYYDVKHINKLNSTIPISPLYAVDSEILSNDVLKQMVEGYDLPQKTGIGVVIMAEYMNKVRVQASYVLIVFNIETRDIIDQKQFVTKPAGFGFRNYWAGSFYKVFSTCRLYEANLN